MKNQDRHDRRLIARLALLLIVKIGIIFVIKSVYFSDESARKPFRGNTPRMERQLFNPSEETLQ